MKDYSQNIESSLSVCLALIRPATFDNMPSAAPFLQIGHNLICLLGGLKKGLHNSSLFPMSHLMMSCGLAFSVTPSIVIMVVMICETGESGLDGM